MLASPEATCCSAHANNGNGAICSSTDIMARCAHTVGSRGGRWPLTRDAVTKAADPVSSRPSTTCGGDNPSSPILMSKNWHPRPRPTSRTGPVLRHRLTASHHLQPPSCVSEPPSIGAHPVNARHRRLVRSGARTLSPDLVVTALMVSMSTSWDSSGRPRQFIKAAPCGRRAALCPMQARGVRPAGRSPRGARLRTLRTHAAILPPASRSVDFPYVDRRYAYVMRPLRYSINVTLDGCSDHRVMLADEDFRPPQVVPRMPCEQDLFFAPCRRESVEIPGSAPPPDRSAPAAGEAVDPVLDVPDRGRPGLDGVGHLEDRPIVGLDNLTVYLRFPREHWNRIRHSNFIERTFGETRRRVKVI